MTPLFRVLRGLGALALLLLGLVGIPVALIMLGGNPLPAAVSWDGVRDALLTRDDGTLLVWVLTVVGWIAWLVFAVSVISELLALLSGERIRLSLPGLAGPQRVAAGLLLSVVAMVTAPPVLPQQPVATTPVSAAAPITEQRSVPPADAPVPAGQTGRPADGHVHRVQPGDDLWSLAEQYYGQGLEWRRIAAANPKLLTGGPDRLEPGWRLVIPGIEQSATGGQRTVTVRRGETLSVIAERELGSAARWHELYRANRAQLSDPDEIPVGLQLIVPGTMRSAPDQKKATDQPDREESKSGLEPTPTPAPTTEAGPTSEPAPTAEPTPTGQDHTPSPADRVVPLVAVGSLLAAGLLEGLAWRRRVQLQTRPLGRRIPHPTPPVIPVTAALGQRQRPMSLRTLDRAVRAIAAHSRSTGTPPPPLELALVSDDLIELVLAEETPDAPVGFTVRGRSWLLSSADAGYLASVPGIGESLRPWPALVTVGRDEADRQVLADLESLRILHLDPAHEFDADGVLAALAVELSFSPWADEMILTLVGRDDRLPNALGKHNVTQTDDLDSLLDRLEQRAAMQRAHQPYALLSQHRVDPDLADPWAPEIVLVNQPMSSAQQDRLATVLDTEPRVAMAAVVVGSGSEGSWSLTLSTDPNAGRSAAVLEPSDLSLVPQRLAAPELEAVLDLVDVTGSDRTTDAPWWSADETPPGRPPDNVAYLDRRWAAHATETERGSVIMKAASAAGDPGTVHHPTLLLLGPVELIGSRGPVPPRAAKQCLEYCAWLLENPGTTAQAMTAALAVAEGTRRSNMSRLRSWLGESPDGEQYLPDAYTGRITLHPAVSSDWQQLQLLTVGGVNRTRDDLLRAALELVRGAPLADAAPGQWYWAEELRTDIISCIRDIGAELTDRALLAGDIDLARWAAARALVAAPGDELLLTARIRTEHLAGNPVETERLSRQVAAQARTLGVDLDPETVILLQQVVEGRVRARLA